MKATGIIRRVDDLGRVIIPKEIRRTLKIRDGDPLEIFTDNDGGIVLKKYSLIGSIGNLAKDYAEALASTTGCIAMISDKDRIVAVSGLPQRNFIDRAITDEFYTIIDNRMPVLKQDINITRDDTKLIGRRKVIVPIISEGDALGAVILIAQDNIILDTAELKVATCIALAIGKGMEQ